MYEPKLGDRCWLKIDRPVEVIVYKFDEHWPRNDIYVITMDYNGDKHSVGVSDLFSSKEECVLDMIEELKREL